MMAAFTPAAASTAAAPIASCGSGAGAADSRVNRAQTQKNT